ETRERGVAVVAVRGAPVVVVAREVVPVVEPAPITARSALAKSAAAPCRARRVDRAAMRRPFCLSFGLRFSLNRNDKRRRAVPSRRQAGVRLLTPSRGRRLGGRGEPDPRRESPTPPCRPAVARGRPPHAPSPARRAPRPTR